METAFFGETNTLCIRNGIRNEFYIPFFCRTQCW